MNDIKGEIDKLEEGSNDKDKALFSLEAIETFDSLNFSIDDLERIPGFTSLNFTSQSIVAYSFSSILLERANKDVSIKQAEALQDKGFFGKLGAGITNAFKIGKQNKEAIEVQQKGGLEKHQVELTRLVDWAKTFDLGEIEIRDNTFHQNFLSGLDLETLNEDQKKIALEFNGSAARFSVVRKEHQVFAKKISKQDSKRLEEYNKLQIDYLDRRAEMSNLLSNELALPEKETLMMLNKVDANVNMIQFMAANPDLEKDWQEMLANKSMLRKAFAKENLKFMAGGYAGRAVFAGVLGAVALPVVAATIGAWRGKVRGYKALREKDKALDKKEIGQSQTLMERKKILDLIKDLVPKEFALNPEDWLDTVDQETKNDYKYLKIELEKCDKKLEKEEKNKAERKTLSSEILIQKTRSLIDNIQAEEDTNKKDELLAQLSRRLDFNRDLFNRGLINFGKIEERTANLLDFYQLLNEGQILLLTVLDDDMVLENKKNNTINDQGEDVSRSANYDRRSVVVGKMKKRANALLQELEFSAEKKLDENRRSFIRKKMRQGAAFGAVFASAGTGLHDLTGGWAGNKLGEAGVWSWHKVTEGFHSIARNTQIDEHLASVNQTLHLDKAAEVVAGAVHQVGDTVSKVSQTVGLDKALASAAEIRQQVGDTIRKVIPSYDLPDQAAAEDIVRKPMTDKRVESDLMAGAQKEALIDQVVDSEVSQSNPLSAEKN